MTCVVGSVLWWLCGFGHLVVILWVVHKCRCVLGVSMGSLRDKVDEGWCVVSV